MTHSERVPQPPRSRRLDRGRQTLGHLPPPFRPQMLPGRPEKGRSSRRSRARNGGKRPSKRRRPVITGRRSGFGGRRPPAWDDAPAPTSEARAGSVQDRAPTSEARTSPVHDRAPTSEARASSVQDRAPATGTSTTMTAVRDRRAKESQDRLMIGLRRPERLWPPVTIGLARFDAGAITSTDIQSASDHRS